MRLRELDDGCERKKRKEERIFSRKYNCCDGSECHLLSNSECRLLQILPTKMEWKKGHRFGISLADQTVYKQNKVLFSPPNI